MDSSRLLGTDYERKKQKLMQELQLDYKHNVFKKKDLKSRDPQQQPEGLSLPIDERISVKEKLREERNKEYNLFLQEQAQVRKLKKRTSVTHKPGQIQASDGMKTNIVPLPKERCPSRKDAAILTEALNDGTSTWIRGPVQRRRRRWQIYRVEEPYSSEDEINTDREDEFDLKYRRGKDRDTQEPEHKEEMTARERRVNRVSQDIKEMEAPVPDQNSNDTIWKSDFQMPGSMKTPAKPAVSKDEVKFATGLLIGKVEEQTVTQMRKEQYRQDLLRQIAEKQRKKTEEKRLELRVAVSGATDPEKEPNGIQQVGSVNHDYNSLRRDVPHKPGKALEAEGKHPNPSLENGKPTENTEQRANPGKSQLDFSAALRQLPGKTVPTDGMELPQGVPSLDYFGADYHRDFSNILGEPTVPRVAGVAPPVPPIVLHTYKTPYDAAYYYYGTRNPLDPHLPHNPNGLPGGNQHSGNSEIPSQRTPPLISSGHTEAPHQHRASALVFEELHVENSNQRRESALSYKEALKLQIKESEERRKREKEEEARSNAKIEAEIRAYNPWGRGGGGAPIKDQQGKLFSDLNQMHRINEALYRNPLSTPGAEARSLYSHQLTGLKDQPPTQQDSYKEALKQQIEENRRKKQEEKECIRIEEEKEEKRLAVERARLQQEYEEEQRKEKKKIELKLKKQGWIHQAERHRKEEEKVVRQEKETEKVPQSTRAREEKDLQLNYEQRQSSPPIPTLQKKVANLEPSRPSSVSSRRSSRTNRSVSASPDKIPRSQDGQQEAVRVLSAMRRYLKEEQRRLDVHRTDSQETHYTPVNRRRPKVDDFESAHGEAVLSSARAPSPADPHANRQNIREFIQLKDRDTASRQEVRAMYPDPPTDAQSLDIQQQALLCEQQRKIRLMNRLKDDDFLDHQLGDYYPWKKPGRVSHRNPTLPSESTFIDVYSGDAPEEQRSPQPSAGHQERTAPRRRLN
ncbi:centrosome and spindle pole-associated protein 1 isoform X2 [Archocentrus centrarchus]|nr:centrosome and spindle pole-associated protein 1 isoform X2 [Archocentrus centrarchus]